LPEAAVELQNGAAAVVVLPEDSMVVDTVENLQVMDVPFVSLDMHMVRLLIEAEAVDIVPKVAKLIVTIIWVDLVILVTHLQKMASWLDLMLQKVQLQIQEL
jgi:hypothetical protein